MPLNTHLPDGVTGTHINNHRTHKITITRTEIPKRKQAMANYSILDLSDYMTIWSYEELLIQQRKQSRPNVFSILINLRAERLQALAVRYQP